METKHLEIIRNVLKLKIKNTYRVNQFIEKHKNDNIADLIKDKQCDFYIFGSFTPFCEHLMAYIIADSVIRHNAGNWYVNQCIQTLLVRVKNTKLYAKDNTVFENVYTLVHKCLEAYKDVQQSKSV